MSDFVVHPIHPDVEVRITGRMPPLSGAMEARIDQFWDAAVARVEAHGAGRLFNGVIFTIDTISPGRLTGHLTEYRRQVAQMEDNALYGELALRPLAVCGVLSCRDGIVIGRRHAGAIYQPGMWQLCPAGSVDAGVERSDGTMDFRRQLITELREELGIAPDRVSDATPLCLVEHPGSHVCDLAMAIRTTLGAGDILRLHAARGDPEYETIRVIPISELSAFVQWAGVTLVPPARTFLAAAGLVA
jgi:hypothetical protein